MPINLYKEKTGEKIDWLCDDIWDLPTQIETLQTWIKDNKEKLTPDKYVADIGFDIRKNAAGGGAALDSETMKIMGDLGIDLFLSEYPNSM